MKSYLYARQSGRWTRNCLLLFSRCKKTNISLLRPTVKVNCFVDHSLWTEIFPTKKINETLRKYTVYVYKERIFFILDVIVKFRWLQLLQFQTLDSCCKYFVLSVSFRDIANAETRACFVVRVGAVRQRFGSRPQRLPWLWPLLQGYLCGAGWSVWHLL